VSNIEARAVVIPSYVFVPTSRLLYFVSGLVRFQVQAQARARVEKFVFEMWALKKKFVE
jgi:hypothetical protein